MKKSSRAVTVNTKQDLSVLTMPQLKKLREKADEMSLKEFRDRIEARIVEIREQGARLSEREVALREAIGALPYEKPGRFQHAFWSQDGSTLAIEIPEGELVPIRIENRTTWQWSMSGEAIKRERASLRAERNADEETFLTHLLSAIQTAWRGENEVRAIMYQPVRAGGKRYRLMPYIGRVVAYNEKNSAFQLSFDKEVQE